MKKEWYIFLNSSHVGPYSLDEIKAFISKRDIKENTLLWKEGMSEWLPLKKLDLFALDEDDKSDPPPIPLEVLSRSANLLEKMSVPLILKDNDNIEDDTDVEIIDQTKTGKTSWVKYLILSFFILTLSTAFYIFKSTTPADMNIKSLSPSNREQLENQLLVGDKIMSFAMALAMDQSNIWVSTNQKNDLRVTIDLKAHTKKLLSDDNNSDEEIVVRLQGEISHHLGHFKTMKLIKGSKFYPGEYSVHIQGKKIHFINKYLNLNISSLNQEFAAEFQSLIFSGNSREFERKLVERHIQKIGNLLKPLQEKLEKFQTLKSLNEKNLDLFSNHLKRADTGKKFLEFEKDYIKEISPIVQVLVLTANSDLEKDLSSQKINKEIIEAGKKIGENMSEMLSTISGQKKLDQKIKNKWLEYFQKKSNAINALIAEDIVQLELQIKEIK